MTCNDCKLAQTTLDSISVAAHETAMAREERRNKRQIIVTIVLIVALVITNLAWLITFNQYDFSTELYDYTQDGRGINIIGDDNEVDQNGTETDYLP